MYAPPTPTPHFLFGSGCRVIVSSIGITEVVAFDLVPWLGARLRLEQSIRLGWRFGLMAE